MGQKGFWDFEEHQQELINKNKTLKHLNDIIPWELFRAELETIHKKDRKSNAGRKPTDVILMFKLLGTSINTDFPGSGNVTSRAPVSWNLPNGN